MKKRIYDFCRTVKSIFYKIAGQGSHFCRIEEINALKRIVVIHCRGVNSPIKLTFDEIISDFVILSNLSSRHASWVGYYYGKYYSDLISKKHDDIVPPNFDFSIGNSMGRFNIIMLNRYGDLIYSDKDNNKTYIISPVHAMISEKIIKFNSIEACYVGILAGISNAKKNSRKLLSNLPNSHLRLVK